MGVSFEAESPATLAAWSDYLELARNAAELQSQLWDPDDERLRAALYQQFAMSLAQGYFLYFQADPNYPDFVPFENSAFLAQPNPDAVYHYSAIDGGGVYRISGQRGTVPVLGLATAGSLFGMSDSPGPGYDNYDVDSLHLDAAGDFEVILSTERPTGHTGDWWYLNPSTGFVIVRQFSYDWGNEVDPRLAIERLDVAPLRLPMTPAAVDERLRGLFGQYVRGLSQVCLGYMGALRARECSDQVRLQSFDSLGNGGDWPQAYYEVMFDLAPGEALVLHTDLPEEHVYWNVQVIDELWNQVDILHRHSSINGFTAHIGDHGTFCAVLSPEDPGVPNWLDTGGRHRGMLIGRWYRCSSHPVPTATKVPLAELRDHLPPTTPITTPDQRAQQLRARRVGAQLRRRW